MQRRGASLHRRTASKSAIRANAFGQTLMLEVGNGARYAICVCVDESVLPEREHILAVCEASGVLVGCYPERSEAESKDL